MVTIGDDCFISHGAMFINDPFAIGGPGMRNREVWRPTRIGNHVSIGTNATILPVSICDGVVIGAGSVVTRDISEAGIYAGNPRASYDVWQKSPKHFQPADAATEMQP